MRIISSESVVQILGLTTTFIYQNEILMNMVLETQVWSLQGWNRDSSPIVSASPSYAQQDFVLKNEGDDTLTMETLPSGERLDSNGYLTDAPITLGDDDYVHRMYSEGELAWWDFDASWTAICRVSTRGSWPLDGSGYVNWRETMKRELRFTGYRYGDGCDTEANHYWVDETQGPFTVGCSDEDADNYTTDANYMDDEVCTYSCSDPNRNTTDEGKCEDSCVEGYGFNDDGICDASVSTDLNNMVSDLPWRMIGGGVAVLAVAKFGLPLLISKK